MCGTLVDDAYAGQYCPGACGLNEGPIHRHKDHYDPFQGLVRGDILGSLEEPWKTPRHPRGIDGQIMSAPHTHAQVA